MNININGNELQNQTIFDAMQIGNPESTKGQTVNGKTILGANLKLNQEDDSIEGKRQEARQQQQKHDASDDVDMDQILDAAMTMDLNQSVQQGLDDIKNSMNLLEADLKGIKVDEEV